MTLAATAIKGKKGFQKRATENISDESIEDTNIDVGFDIDPTKTYVFETLKKSDIPRIENLGARAKAYDPTLKRYRELRYVSVAQSIYYDEQHESYDDYPDTPLMFYRNQILVKGSDKRLMEYMMNHPLCEDSPYAFSGTPPMFKLMDKDAEEEIKAKRHAKEQEAYKAVDEMSIEDVKPIARIIFGITETSDVAIKNAMYDLIKKEKKGSEKMSNAEKVLDNLINPKLVRKYNIQSAIDRGILVADTAKGRVTIASTEAFVCILHGTKSPDAVLNDIVNFTLTPDGEKAYAEIRRIL